MNDIKIEVLDEKGKVIYSEEKEEKKRENKKRFIKIAKNVGYGVLVYSSLSAIGFFLGYGLTSFVKDVIKK